MHVPTELTPRIVEAVASLPGAKRRRNVVSRRGTDAWIVVRVERSQYSPNHANLTIGFWMLSLGAPTKDPPQMTECHMWGGLDGFTRREDIRALVRATSSADRDPSDGEIAEPVNSILRPLFEAADDRLRLARVLTESGVFDRGGHYYSNSKREFMDALFDG